MKKKYIILLTLITVFLGTWVYQANKFEQEVKDNYLPFLEKYKSGISYKSVEINKYKFKIIFNKVKILSFYSDQLIIKTQPFANKIYIDSFGSNEKLPVTKNILYAPGHYISLVINKSFFKQPNDLDLKVKYGKLKLFDAEADRELLNFDDYNLTLNHKEQDKDNYILNLDSKSKNVELGSLFTQFFISEILKLFSGLEEQAKINTRDEEDYYLLFSKVAQLHGAASGSNKVNIVYPKELLTYIVEALEKPDNINSALLLETLLKKDISFDIKSASMDQVANNDLKFKLSSNKNLKLELDSNYSHNYNAEQKSQLIEWLSDYMQKTINRDFNKLISEQSSPIVFSQEDFMEIFAPFANIKNLSFSAYLDYSKADNTFTHSVIAKLNNYDFEYKGAYKEDLYNAALNVSRPVQLLNRIGFFNEKVLSSFLAKLQNKDAAKQLKKATGVIKQFSLGVLEALNKNGPLNENDPLSITIESNKQFKDLKINNKSFSDIFMDPRIQALTQNLNDEEVKNNPNNTSK